MKRAASVQQRRRSGFTFVEVFAAMVFLAILVPAIVAGLNVANRASVVAERGAIAGELAENKMNEALVENTWQTGANTKGDFGTSWPGYRWEMNSGTWDQDNVNTVTKLSVQVYFPVHGQEHSFQLSTLVSGTSLVSGSSQSSL